MISRRIGAGAAFMLASLTLSSAQAQAPSGNIELNIQLASGMSRTASANGEVDQQIFTSKSTGWACRLVRVAGPPQASLLCTRGEVEVKTSVHCQEPKLQTSSLVLSKADDHSLIAGFLLMCQ